MRYNVITQTDLKQKESHHSHCAQISKAESNNSLSLFIYRGFVDGCVFVENRKLFLKTHFKVTAVRTG